MLREIGYARVRLDPGREKAHPGREKAHSKALFASSGYLEIAPYNRKHIADYWAEKALYRSERVRTNRMDHYLPISSSYSSHADRRAPTRSYSR